MKNMRWLLLLFVCFRLHAQTVSNADSMSVSLKDSVWFIEKMISDAKKISVTDTATILPLLRVAAAKANKLNLNHEEGEAWFTIGEVQYINKNYDRSINAYTRARNIFYKTGEAEKEALSYVYMARSQYYRGNYTMASQNLNVAIERAQQAHSALAEAEADEYLGLLYNFFQIFKAGASFSLKSLAYKKNIGDEIGSIRVANGLSDIYYEERKFDSALYYANIALQSAAEKNLITDIYLAHISIAAAKIRLKKLKEAEQEIGLLQQKNTPLEDINFLIRYYVLLANFYFVQTNKTTAFVYYDSAMHVSDSMLFPELKLIVYKNIAESFYEYGDFKSAYEYDKKYNQQLTNMYSGINAVRLGKMEGNVNKEVSDNEIKYLNKENQLKQLQLLHEAELRLNIERESLLKDSVLQKETLLRNEISKSNTLQLAELGNEKKLHAALKRENGLQFSRLNGERKLRLSLITGLSVALCMSVIIFYQYQRQKNKNSIIKKQSDELQTLIKEIHHRVKNNMQIVSSLLDLQSLTIKDGEASEAVKESKNRVQSMALIHQNLYHEGNLKGIQMQDYIQSLASNLFDSYNIEKNKIKLRTEIEHLQLDVDTVIPIGLIVNELISNSLKYAFKGRQSGEVSVTLKHQNKELILSVIDDGNGFEKNWNNDVKHSFGYKLIKAFAQKLKAKLDVYNNNGACFVMHISKYKLS